MTLQTSDAVFLASSRIHASYDFVASFCYLLHLLIAEPWSFDFTWSVIVEAHDFNHLDTWVKPYSAIRFGGCHCRLLFVIVIARLFCGGSQIVGGAWKSSRIQEQPSDKYHSKLRIILVALMFLLIGRGSLLSNTVRVNSSTRGQGRFSLRTELSFHYKSITVYRTNDLIFWYWKATKQQRRKSFWRLSAFETSGLLLRWLLTEQRCLQPRQLFIFMQCCTLLEVGAFCFQRNVIPSRCFVEFTNDVAQMTRSSSLEDMERKSWTCCHQSLSQFCSSVNVSGY